MKMTDQEILDYIWDETLSAVARNTFIRYMGDELGTYSLDEVAERAESFALLSVSRLVLR